MRRLREKRQDAPRFFYGEASEKLALSHQPLSIGRREPDSSRWWSWKTYRS